VTGRSGSRVIFGAALLAGLLLAGVVVVVVLLRERRAAHAPPGHTTTTTVPLPPSTTPPPPAPTEHTATVSDGSLVVDGKPFFPIFSWGECTDGFETSLSVGTTVYVANRCGGLEAQLSVLSGRALSAALVGETVPADGTTIGTFYPDEPDGHGMTASTLPDIPPSDERVRFMTLTNHFYSGAAPLAAGRAIYQALVEKADMVGFDLYPLQNWCRPERLVDVYLAQRELVALARGRPTYQWIEAAGMTCPHEGPTEVTPATVTAESWLAIAGGARGLGFFPPAAWTGDVGRAIKGVTDAIGRLGPALLAPDAPATVEPVDGLVKVGARRHRGELVIVAVNAGYEAGRATITVPGLRGRSLTDTLSGATVTPSGEYFTVAFPPLAARVWVTGSS
jgi:hypothetical protein